MNLTYIILKLLQNKLASLFVSRETLPWLFVVLRELHKLTKLFWFHVLDGMNAGQILDPALNAGSLLAVQLVHAFDHLLLSVNPVQVIAQDRQAHGLQDVGVLEDDPIGP